MKNITIFVFGVLLSAFSFAQNAHNEQRFDIDSQPLSKALYQFSQYTNMVVLAPADVVKGKTSAAVNGNYTPLQALEIILADSGTDYEVKDKDTLLIRTSAPVEKEIRKNDDSSKTREVLPAKSKLSIIEEITVTATKRIQGLQDTPLSIAALSGQEIERRGLLGMEDYLRPIPGVNQIDRGAGRNAVVIRGITTSPQSENFSSGTTVATYFGETPTTASTGIGAGGMDIKLVDIERVEVLRGPQGTTFGSASLGGTVRVIPAAPELDKFSARIVGNYSNTSGNGGDNNMVQGIFNVPLIEDQLAIRAVAYRYENGGFHENIAGSDPAFRAGLAAFGAPALAAAVDEDDIGNDEYIGGRISLLWQPNDDLKFTLSYLYQDIVQEGRPESEADKFQQTRFQMSPVNRSRGNGSETSDSTIELINGVLEYDLNWASFLASASWIDGSSLFQQGDVIIAGPNSSNGESDFQSFTGEVRLASNFDGPLQFLGGFFYEDIDEQFDNSIYWLGSTASLPGFLGTDPLFLIFREERDTEQLAFFGELSYNLTERLTVAFGWRAFHFNKSDQTDSIGAIFGTPPGGPGVIENLGTNDTDNNFKFHVSYKPNDETLLYALYSEGFRLGRPTSGVPIATCDVDNDGIVDGSNVPVDATRNIESDLLENIEVGGKFTMLDGRLIVNADIYHIDWTGLPIRTRAAAGGCPTVFTANVGEASSFGIEFQTNYYITEGLRLDFGGSYLDAELTEDAPQLNAVDGDRLPGAPKINGNAAIQYDFELSGNPAFIRADAFYTGSFFGNLTQDPLTKAGGYVKLDARAGISWRDFDIELYVRNLTNEDDYTWRALGGGGGPDFGYRLRPRTVGVQLAYNFQ